MTISTCLFCFNLPFSEQEKYNLIKKISSDNLSDLIVISFPETSTTVTECFWDKGIQIYRENIESYGIALGNINICTLKSLCLHWRGIKRDIEVNWIFCNDSAQQVWTTLLILKKSVIQTVDGFPTPSRNPTEKQTN